MMGNREQISECTEKATAIIIKEISESGIKVQYNAQGQVKGRYTASHLETVDITQKLDGTFEYESRAIESTPEGEVIVLTGKGTGRQTTATTESLSGSVTYMTQSQKLGWLNSTKGWVEGTVNQVTNETSFKTYSTS